MSETKRVALTTLSTNKCDKKSGKNFSKTVRLNISLIEPNEHSCSVFDYSTLLNSAEKKRLKKKQQQSDGKVNGAVDPFDDEDDEDVKRIARQFEEKYGGSGQKPNRCQTYKELGAGYDENDSFIDNTDACDEALSEEMQTFHGGYYVNSGPLEFKRVELSDADDLDDFKGKKRKFNPNVIRDDTESEEEDNDDDDEDCDDEEEDDEDEDEEEEIEEEIITKENGELERVEEKIKKDEKSEDLSPSAKKMKIAEKTEEKQEPVVTTKTEPIVLNHEDTGIVKKKRKKRTLTVAERQQLLEEQLYDEEVQARDNVNSSVTVPTIPLQTVGNVNINNSNKYNNAAATSTNSSIPSVTVTVTKTGNNSSATVTTPLPSNPVITSNTNNVNNSNTSSRTSSPTNSSAGPHQNSTNNGSVKQNKKKSMTVKALLEEKRGSNPSETGNVQPGSNESAPVTSTAVPVTTTAVPVTNAVTTTSVGLNGNSVTSVEVKKPVIEHKSVNDVIEFVISSARDGDSSKDSSSSASKSQSGVLQVCTDSDLSTESSDSQLNKPTQPTNPSVSKPVASNVEIPPVPDNLPNDIIDLINSIKLSSKSDVISKRVFPDDVNNMLLSLEKKSQAITSANRSIIYEHLAGFLPCSKFTLVKRVKKLYFDSVEDEMNEPIRKLKTTIDTVMPSLLEKYSKDCQNVAADKSNNEPPSTDASGEATIAKIGAKIPRRKFVWNNEMRLYVREIIELRNQCFLIKNPRRETRDAYISSFLASKIQPLWPPGWMKTSTLLREAGEIQTARNKKKVTPTISPSHLSHQVVSSQSPQQAHSQQQYNQQKSPIQSLLNVSLPSSTTLTPAVIGSSTSIGYNSKLQDRSNHNHSKRSPVTISPSQLTVSVSSPSNTSHGLRPSEQSVSVLSRSTTSVASHPTLSKAQKPNPATPSPPKKQSISPSSNNNHNINSAPNPAESQNSMKEQFPLYNLVKNQTSSSFKINSTEIEVLNTTNSVKNENPLILSPHKSDKKHVNRKFDISANNSSSSISLLSNNKECNNLKQDRDRQNVQTVLMSSDLSLNSGVAAGINHKSNKNGDKINIETVNNIGGGTSKKNKSQSDIENRNKSNLITLNGLPMSFTQSSSTVNANSKIKREIKTEDLNVNVNNSNKDVNIDSILDLSSSNCGSSRTENNSNTSSVINKLSNNSKCVIKNVTSVNERTAHNNSSVVYTSESRMSVVSSKPSSSSQDLTLPNNRDQKCTTISSGHANSNTSSSNSNKKPTSQSSNPVRSLKQRILQDQPMSTSSNLERNLKRSLDDKNDIKTNTQSNQSITAHDVKKKVRIEPSSPVISSSSAVVTGKQSEVKCEIKTEVKYEPYTPAQSPATTTPAPTVDYEHQMTLETVTATDILSQLINESLLGPPHHHEEVVVHTSPPDEIIGNQQQVLMPTSDGSDRDISNNKDRRNNTGPRHQRLPSGDQDAKMQMEVDQVMQDLAILREMSGCGSSSQNVDDVSSHKSISGHKTMSGSQFFSSSSCSSTSSYSLASETKKPGQTASSYQNEFYKHLMQKEAVSPPSSILSSVHSKQDNVSRHQSFQNSPYTSDNILEDIPNKYSSISLHSVSGQGKQNSQSNKQSQLNQQSPTNVGQSMPHLSPGVIQHHSSSYDQSPPQSSHYQYQQHHINLHSQSVLSSRNSKTEDYHSVLTKSSSQPYNRFDWSVTGNNHQSPPPQ